MAHFGRPVYARFTLDLRSGAAQSQFFASLDLRSRLRSRLRSVRGGDPFRSRLRSFLRSWLRSGFAVPPASLGFTLGVTLSLRSNSLDLRSDPCYARFTLAVTLDLRNPSERNEERNAERNTERKAERCPLPRPLTCHGHLIYARASLSVSLKTSFSSMSNSISYTNSSRDFGPEAGFLP